MSYRPGAPAQSRQGSNSRVPMSIRLPSSPSLPPAISTPTNLTHPAFPSQIASPRRAPLPPSPALSNHAQAPWLDQRAQSLDVPRMDPQTSSSRDKRLPLLPSSPSKGGSFSSNYAGAYDNKLVSTTLSQLPPIPSSGDSAPPAPLLKSTSSHTTAVSTASARPSFSTPPSLVMLPNGAMVNSDHHEHATGGGRSMIETMHHSSPSSPWSLLTVHALPLFAGGPLKTPIEDLNQLCHAHIIGTSQRAPPSRIVTVLSSDFREFVASGMLTLRAKFETLEEAKVVGRAAEVWSFFWTQILPYLEGVFLPFTQVMDLPASTYVPVRHILLSGFLVHILLPLVPRLVPLLATSPESKEPELQRILQMSLVLLTQAKFSSFVPGQENRDEEVRQTVESMGKTVRRRISMGIDETQNKQSRLSRGTSLSNNGRWRRRGWRASSTLSQNWEAGQGGRWAVQEDDTPAQTPVQAPDYAVTSTTLSTLMDGTLRRSDLDQKTPQPTYVRRPMRTESDGSSDLTPVATTHRPVAVQL